MRGVSARARGAAAIGAAAIVMPGLLGAAPAHAASDPTPPKRVLSGWLPYWTTQDSVSTFTRNSDLFSDVSPFWHDARQDGKGGVYLYDHLSKAERWKYVRQMRGKGVKIVPSVTDGTGAHYMRKVLGNRAKRQALVAAMVNKAVASGYDGLDLDFETFAFSDGQSTWGSTKKSWGAFVRELSAALHAKGKILTAAVPTSDYWVYDFATLGKYLDKVRVMTYDYSTSSPGPISPLWWFASETSKMLKVIPGEKLQMGIPTYGRVWTRYTTTLSAAKAKRLCVAGTPTLSTSQRSLDAQDNDAIAVNPTAAPSAWRPASGITFESSPTHDSSGEVHVRYKRVGRTTNGACAVFHREAWLANAKTANDRTKKALGLGASGVAFWTVGGEDPTMWSGLRTQAKALGVAATNVTLTSAASQVRSGAKVALTVKVASRGRPLSSAAVTLQFKGAGKSTWANVGRAVRTDSTGTAKFTPSLSSGGTFRAVVSKGTRRNAGVSREVKVSVAKAKAKSGSATKVAASDSGVTLSRSPVPTALAAGTATSVRGVVAGGKPDGVKVVLARYHRGAAEWRNVASAKVGTDGHYEVPLTVGSAVLVTERYRIAAVAADGADLATDGFSVTVR